MKKFLVLILFCLPTLAKAALTIENPQVSVKGTLHYLVDYNSATGEEAASATGFCRSMGFSNWQMVRSSIGSIHMIPMAELSEDGVVMKTHSTNANGDLWAIEQLVCTN